MPALQSGFLGSRDEESMGYLLTIVEAVLLTPKRPFRGSLKRIPILLGIILP